MKTMSKFSLIPVITAGLGGLALVLRLALFTLGRDEKGLLISGHPLDILTWVVTAAAAALILASVPGQKGSNRYTDNFAPSTAAAIGCFALAGGILLSVLSGWALWPRLELLRNISGLLAIPALILLGLSRWQGKHPFFLLHTAVCLYLTLYAVSHYQVWSSRPQLQNYFFTMAAIVALILFAYYQTAFDAGMGNRRMQLAMGLACVFFCSAAIAGREDAALYLSGAVWALTNLCSLTPVRRRRPNPVTQTPKEDPNEPA